MKTLSITLVSLALAPQAEARKLIDPMDSQNKNNSYEVLFTDPICPATVDQYKYEGATIRSNSGETLKGKPVGSFCRSRLDKKASGDRDGSKPSGIKGRSDESPQNRLVRMVNDSNVKEIFFTYLSFRNSAVKEALCNRAKEGMPITFVNSSTEDPTVAMELVNCGQGTLKQGTDNTVTKGNVKFLKRGMEGGLGYAHNKIFTVYPKTGDLVKIVFSSGNMTSGPVIHHENWNFLTVSTKTHFAQAHECVKNAELDPKAGRERQAYMDSIRDCRKAISEPEESDVKSFFVPGEGERGTDYETGALLDNGYIKKAAWDYMRDGDGVNPGIRQADQILLACHRFFYSRMINALHERMASSYKPELKIIADDDTYYKGVDPEYGVGDTDPAEWTNMEELKERGAGVRFIESNPDEHQLHHSKYLIFGKKESGKLVSKAVFTGAANLTGAGFRKNWENVYYVTVPSVVQTFSDHYAYFYGTVATEVEDLPEKGLVGEYLVPQAE